MREEPSPAKEPAPWVHFQSPGPGATTQATYAVFPDTAGAIELKAARGGTAPERRPPSPASLRDSDLDRPGQGSCPGLVSRWDPALGWARTPRRSMSSSGVRIRRGRWTNQMAWKPAPVALTNRPSPGPTRPGPSGPLTGACYHPGLAMPRATKPAAEASASTSGR